jgi:O-antigen/teichoic acid export membrane protein
VRPFDASGAFHPSGEGHELKRLAVRGAGVTVFSQSLVFAVQMIATVVLARLLTPTDFGVVTMVTTFSLLLMSFGLNGFTEAILQWENLSHFLSSNLFWASLGAGVVLAGGFAEAGSLLARFFGDPRVAQVAHVMSLTIFLGSLSVVHLALLKRAMRFTATATVDVIARINGVATSILLGFMGWGYWALVAGAIAQPLTVGVGAWILCRWIPGRPRKVAGTGAVLRFSMNVYGHFCINYFARNMDNLLVGWRFGAHALGFYKKAYDLFAFTASQFLNPVDAVVVSALSRLNRDRAEYRRFLMGGLSLVAFAGMGLGADLTLIGRDLIRVLLGPGWETAGLIFTFFGPGIGLMLLSNTNGWIHLSIGRADRWFRWGIFEFIVTGLLFVVGLHWGPVGIAAAWTASFWLLTLPAFWYAGRPIDLGIKPVLLAVWRFLLASVVAAAAAGWILNAFPDTIARPGASGAAIRIGLVSVTFWGLYLVTIIVLHGGWEPVYQVARLLPDLLPWGKSRQPEPMPVGADINLKESRVEAFPQPESQQQLSEEVG